MMTTENSRADALTEASRNLIALRHDQGTRDHEIITGIDALEQALAASHVEQPAAAPIDVGVDCLEKLRALMVRLGLATNESLEGFGAALEDNLYRAIRAVGALVDAAAMPAPSPADERAALLEVGFITQDEIHGWHFAPTVGWEFLGKGRALYARAASANETGAEVTRPSGYAYRYRSLGGSVIRFNGGGEVNGSRPIEAIPYWFAAPQPAMAAEAVAIPAGWKLVRVNEHFDALIAALERAESKGYLPDSMREEWANFACDENVTQPAQADARVGLTDEQRDVLTWAIGRANSQGEDACADVLRSILAAHPGQPEPKMACRECACLRSGNTCWKCGSETFKPAAGWTEPELPPIARIRELAAQIGYAIGVHGSQERDLDVIAAPWTEDALKLNYREVMEHIATGLGARLVEVELKPLGRRACTIQMNGWFKPIDLSVCPILVQKPEPRAEVTNSEVRALLQLEEAIRHDRAMFEGTSDEDNPMGSLVTTALKVLDAARTGASS
ncbi:TPA: hypothetical protein QDA94_003034 [Burkholderia vietnamiensis]|nr:hypothetical protein [Burkholderia vietnamiensis]HDR9231362.1 hypothetical protein [Burkholderia vietnamiensis]